MLTMRRRSCSERPASGSGMSASASSRCTVATSAFFSWSYVPLSLSMVDAPFQWIGRLARDGRMRNSKGEDERVSMDDDQHKGVANRDEL